MKTWLKWTLIVLGALLLLFGVMKAMKGKGDAAVKVAVEKATRRTITETVNASGKIYPEVEVKISPDISGEVVELNVQEGDSVRRGQVLARIYADLYALQRDEAASRVTQTQASVNNSRSASEALKASLDQAQQSYERNKKLFDDKVISKAELEQFETTLRSAQANYNAAQQNIRSLQASVQTTQVGLNRANKDLGRTTLVAPMDGVISALSIKKGERVAGNSFNVGTEMMRVADMKSMEVRVDVGENDIVKVNIGDSVDVEVDAYKNRKFKGVVYQIASSVKSSSSITSTNDVTNYEVKIRLEPSSYSDLLDPSKPKKFPFRPGMNANVDIKTRRVENVLSVPVNAVGARFAGSDKTAADKKEETKQSEEEENENTAAISTSDMEEIVFVLQPDQTVRRVVVKTGIQDMTNIEIVSGLKPGEEVVTAPFNAISKVLKDKSKVKVVPRDKLFEK